MLILFLIPPGLAIATYFILVERPYFWSTVLAHLVIFVSYMALLYIFSREIAGHNEYGLRLMGITILIMVVHIIGAFIHGLYIRSKFKRQE